MLFNSADIKPFKFKQIVRTGIERATARLFSKFSSGCGSLFTELNEIDSIEFVSTGQYNAHNILEEAVKFVGGNAKVIITTYAITEEPARHLYRLVHNNDIESLTVLVDKRIQRHGIGIFAFMRSFVNELYLLKIHAKVTLVEGKGGYITIVQSGNYTKNARIEITRISRSPEAYFFHKKWITNEVDKLINHSVYAGTKE